MPKTSLGPILKKLSSKSEIISRLAQACHVQLFVCIVNILKDGDVRDVRKRQKLVWWLSSDYLPQARSLLDPPWTPMAVGNRLASSPLPNPLIPSISAAKLPSKPQPRSQRWTLQHKTSSPHTSALSTAQVTPSSCATSTTPQQHPS